MLIPTYITFYSDFSPKYKNIKRTTNAPENSNPFQISPNIHIYFPPFPLTSHFPFIPSSQKVGYRRKKVCKVNSFQFSFPFNKQCGKISNNITPSSFTHTHSLIITQHAKVPWLSLTQFFSTIIPATVICDHITSTTVQHTNLHVQPPPLRCVL